MSTRKKTIPKPLKDLVWDINIGKDKGIGKCYVCDQELDSKKFHCGHIISEKNMGPTQLNNLKPICATCNLSMGTQNMDDFKKEFFPIIAKIEVLCKFNIFHDLIKNSNPLKYVLIPNYHMVARRYSTEYTDSYAQCIIRGIGTPPVGSRDTGPYKMSNIEKWQRITRLINADKSNNCEICLNFAKIISV